MPAIGAVLVSVVMVILAVAAHVNPVIIAGERQKTKTTVITVTAGIVMLAAIVNVETKELT